MSIADTVNEQMKVAMRAKDKGRLAALRFIRAAIIEEQKTGKGDMGKGDFWTTAGAAEHQNACLSEEPCLFFIAMEGAFGMTPVEVQN